MKYCTKCVMPDTRPSLSLDENGVCDACRTAEAKKKIDWKARRKELEQILDKYRNKEGSNYDCIIPVSGGKDSHYQTIMMKEEFGMNPLCVTAAATVSTELGRRNLKNLQDLGVDHILFTYNPQVRRKLTKIGFERVGDVCWPCHFGIFAYAVRVAVNYNVPLLIWGESSVEEYGGPAGLRDSGVLDRAYLKTYSGWLGHEIDEVIGEKGIEKRDILPYLYPTDEEIREVGVTGLFLGHYLWWDAKKQIEIDIQHGFSVSERRCVGALWDSENLDGKFVDIHDYLMYVKYGFGRATSQACIDIRHGRLIREEAIELANKYDGEVETVKEFCEYIGITEERFWEVVDSFTNKNIFKTDENGKPLRDNHGRLIKNTS
ncbi:N-acetyl sugar amidotransferase [bacterium]|nr:N-acetyl sugar amidotransferase [bacterium]